MLSESKSGKRRYFARKILERCNYDVKYYDKGLRMRLYHMNIMRFEYKTKRMRDINELGIYHLGDLLHREQYIRLGELLLVQSWKVLLFDTCIDMEAMPNAAERELLQNCSNPYFWKELQNKRSTRKYLRDKYLRLVRDRSDRDLLGDMLDAIEYKISLLSNS